MGASFAAAALAAAILLAADAAPQFAPRPVATSCRAENPGPAGEVIVSVMNPTSAAFDSVVEWTLPDDKRPADHLVGLVIARDGGTEFLVRSRLTAAEDCKWARMRTPGTIRKADLRGESCAVTLSAGSGERRALFGRALAIPERISLDFGAAAHEFDLLLPLRTLHDPADRQFEQAKRQILALGQEIGDLDRDGTTTPAPGAEQPLLEAFNSQWGAVSTLCIRTPRRVS